MQQATVQAERTLLVLSPDYLAALYPQPEWAVAFAADPTGAHGTLLPIRVRDCTPPGLLRPLVRVDLVSLPEDAARAALLAGVQQGRAKPTTAPAFPGSAAGSAPPPFPGGVAALAPVTSARLPQVWAWLPQHRRWVLAGLLGLGLLIALLGSWQTPSQRDINTITAPEGTAVIQTGDGTVLINHGEGKRR